MPRPIPSNASVVVLILGLVVMLQGTFDLIPSRAIHLVAAAGSKVKGARKLQNVDDDDRSDCVVAVNGNGIEVVFCGEAAQAILEAEEREDKDAEADEGDALSASPTKAPSPRPTSPPVIPITAAPKPLVPPTVAAPTLQPTSPPVILITAAPKPPTVAPTIAAPTSPPVVPVNAVPTSPPAASPTLSPALRPIPISEQNPDFTDSPTAGPLVVPAVESPTQAPSFSTPSPSRRPSPAPFVSTEAPSALTNATMTRTTVPEEVENDPIVEKDLPQITINALTDYYASEPDVEALGAYFRSFVASLLLSKAISFNATTMTTTTNRTHLSFLYLKNITSFNVELVVPVLTTDGIVSVESTTKQGSVPATVPIVLLLDGTAVFGEGASEEKVGETAGVEITDDMLQDSLHQSLSVYFSLEGFDDVQLAMEEEGHIKDPIISMVHVGGLEVPMGAPDGAGDDGEGTKDDIDNMSPSQEDPNDVVGNKGSSSPGRVLWQTSIIAAVMFFFCLD